MKLSRIRAAAKKEILHIWRDPLSLAMAFLMPVMLLFIFGYAISLDVKNIKTAVYDRDKSSGSRDLIKAFAASGYFDIIEYAEDDRDVDKLLDSGLVFVAISIPLDFSKNLAKEKAPELQVLVDGSDSNTAAIALGYVSAIVESYSAGTDSHPIRVFSGPRVRVWYNPELKSRNFIIPGLIAVIMSVIAALLTSLTIAREWERGTMELLISTPIRPAELLIGKMIPYYLIGFIDVVLSALLAVFLFEVPLRGDPFILMAASGIFLFGGLSLGILISITSGSQLVASQIALVSTFLPAFLLSGFMFSVSNMPAPLRALTNAVPARYFVSMLKTIFLKGGGVRLIAVEAFFLIFFGCLVFAVSVRSLKKRIV